MYMKNRFLTHTLKVRTSISSKDSTSQMAFRRSTRHTSLVSLNKLLGMAWALRLEYNLVNISVNRGFWPAPNFQRIQHSCKQSGSSDIITMCWQNRLFPWKEYFQLVTKPVRNGWRFPSGDSPRRSTDFSPNVVDFGGKVYDLSKNLLRSDMKI